MYKGQLEGFPKEIVEKMLERQVEQGNKRDVSVFGKNKCANKEEGGFDWLYERDLFSWSDVLIGKNFDLFFKRYPKQENNPHPTSVIDYIASEGQQLTFPRKMLVWDTEEIDAEEDLVWAILPDRNSLPVIGDNNCWEHAKELPQKTDNERKAEELIRTANELLELANKLKEGL